MSEVEVTQLQWAGQNLRTAGLVAVEPGAIVARINMGRYSVLYLRSGEKLLVRESVEEIERLARETETQREVARRFKREIRERKASGMPVNRAFAALWEEVSTGAQLAEGQQATLYQELLDWTRRWLT